MKPSSRLLRGHRLCAQRGVLNSIRRDRGDRGDKSLRDLGSLQLLEEVGASRLGQESADHLWLPMVCDGASGASVASLASSFLNIPRGFETPKELDRCARLQRLVRRRGPARQGRSIMVCYGFDICLHILFQPWLAPRAAIRQGNSLLSGRTISRCSRETYNDRLSDSYPHRSLLFPFRALPFGFSSGWRWAW